MWEEKDFLKMMQVNPDLYGDEILHITGADNALECIHSRRIKPSSVATLSFDDVMYSEKYVFVDIAYDIYPTGAVAAAECLFEAPATEENIVIAENILEAIKEQYGIEVSSDTTKE